MNIYWYAYTYTRTKPWTTTCRELVKECERAVSEGNVDGITKAVKELNVLGVIISISMNRTQ